VAVAVVAVEAVSLCWQQEQQLRREDVDSWHLAQVRQLLLCEEVQQAHPAAAGTAAAAAAAAAAATLAGAEGAQGPGLAREQSGGLIPAGELCSLPGGYSLHK